MSNFDKLLPHCTVRLVGLEDGNIKSTGTGFYYFFNDTFTDNHGNLNDSENAWLGIVTNKHVIQNAEEVIFYFNSTAIGEEDYHKDSLRLRLNNETVIYHPEEDVDLCVILAHGIRERLKEKNSKLHIYPVRKDIRISEEKLSGMSSIQNLIIIGYPRSIWDSSNNLPIMRQGVNATPLYKNYQGEEKFAVDVAIYNGSSGSPVFIYDNSAYIENGEVKFGTRVLFVGIISSGHSITEEHTDDIKITEMLHIGIAIKAHKLDIFEELIKNHYED